MKLLFLDGETGGLDEDETSLLSLGLVAWENHKIKNVLEVYIKEPVLRIIPSALEINKIDLRKFNQMAISVEEAQKKIEQFIYQNFGLPKGQVKLAGINIKFDIGFIKKCFSKKFYHKWFQHKSMDLQAIITYLYIKGLIPEDYSSSEEAYKYFNINNGVVRHGALFDALDNVELFEKLLKVEKKCTCKRC